LIDLGKWLGGEHVICEPLDSEQLEGRPEAPLGGPAVPPEE